MGITLSFVEIYLAEVVAGVGTVGVQKGADDRNIRVVANNHVLEGRLLPVGEDVVNAADGAIFYLPVF